MPHRRALFAATVVALIAAGIWIGTSWPFGVARGDRDARPVLAVLPFANLSPAEDDAYFTDGIHEDVLTRLTKIRDLTVLARSEVLRYRDTDKGVGQIAAELNADAVLEGSVRRAGDQLRIVTQLLDPRTAAQLWAETYDRQLDVNNVFAVQTEVARQVARALEVTLSSEEEERIALRPTESLAAYDLYLKGREAYQRVEAKENAEAIRLYRRALEIDAEYALAWAGLGDAFAQRVWGLGFPRAWADSAVLAARQAVELEPNLAEAYKALGVALSAQERRRAALEANLQAVELDPNHFPAVGNIGFEYRDNGRFAEAIPWLRRAVRLARSHPLPRVDLALAYTSLMMEDVAGDWLESVFVLEPKHVRARMLRAERRLARGHVDEAITLIEEVVHDAPGDVMAWMYAAEVAYLARDFERAVVWVQQSMRMAPDNILHNSYHGTEILLGLSLVARGDSDGGRDTLRRAMHDYEQRVQEGAEYWLFPWGIATAHAALGEEQEALEWLERAYDAGFRDVRLPKLDPAFADLRDDPRFKVWLARLEADVAVMRERVIQEPAAGL